METQVFTILSEEVYSRLREMILQGGIPPRTPVREAELVRRMGTSRTPVREALRRLQAEGLLTPVAQVGYIVSEVRLEDLGKVYQVREVLEGLAARLAATHRTRTDLARLADLLDSMSAATVADDNDRLYRLNEEFHGAIARAGQNEYLQTTMINTREIYRRYRPVVRYTAGRRAKMDVEHRALMEAISQGDADQAERLAREHIGHALAFRLEAAGHRPPDGAGATG